MSSNFERLQKIINQAYAENFSCLFYVDFKIPLPGGKPFPCQYCRKHFNSVRNKARHEQNHSGEKIFLVHSVAKLFSDRANMNVNEFILEDRQYVSKNSISNELV